jgi:soluble epoxide hydrolase / lipid-phosphate phosphatase
VTLKDCICLPQIFLPAMEKYCLNLKVKEINTSHWIMLEASDELNEALGEFIKTIG